MTVLGHDWYDYLTLAINAATLFVAIAALRRC